VAKEIEFQIKKCSRREAEPACRETSCEKRTRRNAIGQRSPDAYVLVYVAKWQRGSGGEKKWGGGWGRTGGTREQRIKLGGERKTAKADAERSNGPATYKRKKKTKRRLIGQKDITYAGKESTTLRGRTPGPGGRKTEANP